MKSYFGFIVILVFPFYTFSQNISGFVFNNKKEPLIGANIYWSETKNGVVSGNLGEFQISKDLKVEKKLIASYVGFLPDTLNIIDETSIEFILQEQESLEEVLIKAEKEGVIISDIIPIKTEQITQTELRKSACCDLAGCFETQTTVQPQTTNIITNSKELRILGLSGVYNQILVDGFPVIQGLSYTYGISSIPGTLVENIFVSKGANSVLQGFESISGQINVETKSPTSSDKLILNAYLNSFLEKHVNLSFAFKKGKWANLAGFHLVQPGNKIDRDEDKFLDLPLLNRLLLFNKWEYGNEKNWGWFHKIGFRFLEEQRVGGQFNFNPKIDKGSSAVYGQSVNLTQPEVWLKTGYRFNDNHKLIFLSSGFYHDQNSFFGNVSYQARQKNFYGNLQYELNYSKNILKTGLSFRYFDLMENIEFTDRKNEKTFAGLYENRELIPGIFAENTFQFINQRLTWLIGVRGDHHNHFGFQFTPRTLVKFDLRPQTVLRFNIGTGCRTVNLFSENIGLLISSRDIIWTEKLEPEKAINTGLNLTQKFENKEKTISGYLSLDYYHTSFQNQIFPDYNTDSKKAIIQNFKGTSKSDGFQAELYLNFYSRFYYKTGYNFLNVYRINGEEKEILPFNPKHKFINTLTFKSLSNKFQFDINVHSYGKQRLPDTKQNPQEFQRPDFSEPFTILNGQITYFFKSFELYSGCENFFDFRQEQPIISWQNPFGPYFDTSSVWGPTRGRELYMGFRFYFNKNQESTTN
jgi:outer membrane receptor for ferrienterochelin and colicin